MERKNILLEKMNQLSDAKMYKKVKIGKWNIIVPNHSIFFVYELFHIKRLMEIIKGIKK